MCHRRRTEEIKDDCNVTHNLHKNESKEFLKHDFQITLENGPIPPLPPTPTPWYRECREEKTNPTTILKRTEQKKTAIEHTNLTAN